MRASPPAQDKRSRRVPPSLVLASAALIIPNAAAVALALGDIVVPQRTLAIVCFLLVAVLARHLPGWLSAGLYVAVLAGDLVVIIARLFSLHSRQIFFAFDFAGEIDLLASPLLRHRHRRPDTDNGACRLDLLPRTPSSTSCSAHSCDRRHHRVRQR